MNTDPMRWHENVSAEVLSLVMSCMSARYQAIFVGMGMPKATADALVDRVFHESVVRALAFGSVDGLEAAHAASKGQIQ